MYLSSLVLFLLPVVEASAVSLTIRIPSSKVLPNPNSLPAGTHATLTTLPSSSPGNAQDDIHYADSSFLLTALLTRASTFVFRDLPSNLSQPESYLLDIRCSEYVFAPYRVDIARDGSIIGVWEMHRGTSWDHRGAQKFVASTSISGDEPASSSFAQSAVGDSDVIIDARLISTRTFYEERPKFSPIDLLKNPMILLAVIALGLTFGLPKLIDNMDPEMRAEFEKQSRSAPISTRNSLAAGSGGPSGFDLAGWMAGANLGPVAAVDANSGSATGREIGGNTRKRN